MTKEDFNRLYPFSSEVYDLIAAIEAESKKSIEIEIDSTLQAPATVKIARDTMPVHRILVNPKFENVLGYLILNKCLNIRRIMSVSSEHRFVPSMTAVTQSKSETQVAQSIGRGRLQSLKRHLPYWVNGVVNQITNIPVQMSIEHWIRENLYSLHSQQSEYLQSEIDDCVAGLSKKVKMVTPSIIYSVGNSINCAWVSSIGSFVEGTDVNIYRSDPEVWRQGQKLTELFRSENRDNHTGDISIINAWSKYLRVSDWYVWHPFEDMPKDYMTR